MSLFLSAVPRRASRPSPSCWWLYIIAVVPLVTGKLYNDCTRQGPPDAGSVPVWTTGTGETFFDDYRPLADIEKLVSDLAASHPSLVTLRHIGKSWEGRDLRVMEITSGGVPGDKPMIFLQGGIHAREWIATSAVLYLAYSLLASADKEAGTGPVTGMLQEFVFVVLSPANPDGYVYSWEANRFWRKTRSDREHCRYEKDKVAGVDGNRNWGYTRGIFVNHAGAQSTKDVVNPCLETYEGPGAFSEPEVRAVATYLRLRQKASFARSTRDALGNLAAGPGYVAAFMDYHSFAMMLLPPWGFSALWPAAPDGGYMKELCAALVSSIKSTSGRIFTSGPDLLPASPGTAPDWAYGELGVRATMTVELEGEEASGSFCLPKEKIKSVADEQFQTLLALVAYLRAQGSTPSSKIGLFAGSPPLPKSAAQLWLQERFPALHRHGLAVSTISLLVFGVVLSSAGAVAMCRRGPRTKVAGSEDAISEEGGEIE